MTPYKIGDRVVCPDPGGRWFVGTVTHVHNCGDLSVNHGAWCFRASVEEVRPVMPRDRADLERWGRWWWLEDRAVEVFGFDAYGNIAMYITGNGAPQYLSKVHNWRGPVAAPPTEAGG